VLGQKDWGYLFQRISTVRSI